MYVQDVKRFEDVQDFRGLADGQGFGQGFECYLDLLFLDELEDIERIALTVGKSDGSVFANKFCRSKSEVKKVVSNYYVDHNIYLSLSTCIARKGKMKRRTENMYKRHCIGIDFDKKDFEGMELEDFISHYRLRTGLDYHFIVNSGKGYHFYTLIEGTKNVKMVAELTKRLARLADADIQATIITQMLRLPYSINHKYEEKPVSTIITDLSNSVFERYSLDFIEGKIAEKEVAVPELNNSKPVSADAGNGSKKMKTTKTRFKKQYRCVEKMLSAGVGKGERNQCLGRIVNYFRDVEKYSKDIALGNVLVPCQY